MRLKMFFNHNETVTEAVIKASPIGAASGLQYMNVSIPDLIQYLTLAYTVLLVSEKLYVIYKRYKDRKNEPKE